MRWWICLSLWMLLAAAPTAQDCFRAMIGQSPVQPTLTTAQWNAGLAAAAQIVPRLASGTPSPSGKVVFFPVGMSNTTRVWDGFKPHLATVNLPTLKWFTGSQNNQAAAEWANPACPCWTILLQRLAAHNLTPAQVGGVFLMVTNAYPTLDPQANATLFATHVHLILDQLALRFPNLQIVYLTSNYYGGYDVGQDKTPEPHDYYEGLTLQSIQDSRVGRPWVSAASTYLWADGIQPRAWDNLTLFCSDVEGDGVHLNATGKLKYGQWLFDALRADPTTYGWLW